jgi:hypothetical protein
MPKTLLLSAVAALMLSVRAQAFVGEIPVQFVGEWCQVASEDGGITGTYRRARCPGKHGLRIGPTHYDFYTKARCKLRSATTENFETRAKFRCTIGKNDRDYEDASFVLSLTRSGKLRLKAGD